MERELCAGILFVTKAGKALFLKRSDKYGPKQYRGLYGLPGGHLKKGETQQQAAIRESIEEMGQRPEGELVEINRQVMPMIGDDEDHSREIDYTTYVQIVENEFFPLLNDEHENHVWATLENPPQPIHPGLALTIQKINADELEIAEMMIRGETASPQKYGKMWLFDVRITGTGLSYRSGLDEFVWRDSSLYLNERFVKRCQGLPVIFEHPKGATLDTKEYVERNIGSIFLPYIKGDDVWGIARIYDDFAANIMKENQLSTSPAVVLYGDDVYIKNGEETLLIENKPKILDHLAICFVGVWDKGERPTGVVSTTAGEKVMADADEKAAALEAARKADEAKVKSDAEAKAKADAEAKAKADAEAGETLDKTLKCMDSLSSRFDAFEKQEEEREKARTDKRARKDAKRAAKADAEKAKADQAKKDAEAEEEKKKADAAKAKADAENDVRKRIADVEARLPKQMTDADYAAMADAQVKADRLYLMHGGRAPRPLDGETLLAYRRRMASDLKEHSPAWKGIDLRVIADDTAFGNIETVIYKDAEVAGLNPVAPSEDFLREITEEDVTGRKISKFVGRPSAWMNQFAAPRRRLAGIRNS
jgi:8-oxo-dGTP pyrophosphatase MutT (NUDIX family)